MKNNNRNASVAAYVSRLQGAVAAAAGYRELRKLIISSESDEFWPYGRDKTSEYQFSWGLKLADNGELTYSLRITHAVHRLAAPLEGLPIGALERYTELKRALDDFIHRDGDWPTPVHMPGGSQLVHG
jgi:hypothetical protein